MGQPSLHLKEKRARGRRRLGGAEDPPTPHNTRQEGTPCEAVAVTQTPPEQTEAGLEHSVHSRLPSYILLKPANTENEGHYDLW